MGFIAAVVIWVLASVGALLILVAGMAAACQERDEHDDTDAGDDDSQAYK